MRRRLVTAVSISSVALCFIVAVLWANCSRWTLRYQFEWTVLRGQEPGHVTFGFFRDGEVGICVPWIFHRPNQYWESRCFTISDGLAVLLLSCPALAALLYRGWQSTRVIHYRRCTKCRYNLTGNTSGVCPECGTCTMQGVQCVLT